MFLIVFNKREDPGNWLTNVLPSIHPIFGAGVRLPILIYNNYGSSKSFQELYCASKEKNSNIRIRHMHENTGPSIWQMLKTPYNNMDGYTLSIPTFNFPPDVIIQNNRMLGVQGKFLDAFCAHFKINYNLLVFNASSPKYMINLYAHFQKYEVDFSLNDVGMASNNTIIVNVVRNEFNGQCLLLPKHKQLSVFNDILSPFDKWVWFSLLITTFLMIPLWKKISRITRSRFTWNFIVFNIFRYLLNVGPTGEYRMSYIEKIVLYFYLLLTFLLTTTYQSTLISRMLQPKAAHFFKTFKEFNESNIKLYYMPTEAKDTWNIDPKKIVSEYSISTGLINLYRMAINDTSLAYMVSCEFGEQFVKSAGNQMNDKEIFKVLDEKLAITINTIMIKSSSPFANHLKPFLDRVFESGLQLFWKVQSELESKQLGYNNFFPAKVNDEMKILKFKDMSLAFYILLIGLAASLVTIIAEILINFVEVKFKIYRENVQKAQRTIVKTDEVLEVEDLEAAF